MNYIKKILLVSILIQPVLSFGLELKCFCTNTNKHCKDIYISLNRQNPGTYMKVEFNNGQKTVEGFAKITRDTNKAQSIYKIENQILVKRGDLYTMPAHNRFCL